MIVAAMAMIIRTTTIAITVDVLCCAEGSERSVQCHDASIQSLYPTQNHPALLQSTVDLTTTMETDFGGR